MADPMLQLFQGSTLLASNDNWKEASNQAAISATGMAPPNDAESAILISLNPGAYTAILSGVGNTTGNALVEAYDVGTGSASYFTNISTRGFVGTNDNVLIAGIIVRGSGSREVILRALGPTLGRAPFNLPNSLSDPFLYLRDANGTRIQANDNWKDSQQAEIQASGRETGHDDRGCTILCAAGQEAPPEHFSGPSSDR